MRPAVSIPHRMTDENSSALSEAQRAHLHGGADIDWCPQRAFLNGPLSFLWAGLLIPTPRKP